jgi:thiamine biosynthesis lipoprotein
MKPLTDGYAWHAALAAAVLLTACSRVERLSAVREAMGTFVEIKAEVPAAQAGQARAAISAAFDVVEAVEAATSHYRDDSDIAAIAAAEAGQAVPVAEWTYRCLELAREVTEATGGRYDVTAGPLVNLWGFGPDPASGVPGADVISNALRTVGMAHVVLLPGRAAVSTVVAGIQVDLSSVAKGLAADAAAEELLARGLSNILVNAGGEIRTASTGTKTWRVGIQVPREGARADEVFGDRVLAMQNGCVATSGSYRRYFTSGSTTYSHIIDPRTGRPLQTRTVSVTVRAARCGRADAWATGLFTLSAEEGVRLAEGVRGIECLIVERPLEEGGAFEFHSTGNFAGF